MANSIATYRAKRDFKATPEPAPPRRARKATRTAIFVVQKHDASRLHWDFRLEHGGVLWSWAVPKGPSMDPADKRLALHVEDHPVDYAGFEGTIPAGNYGAGTVEIWDHGTWSPVEADAAAALARGELKFVLHGSRLNGHFVLVRMKPRGKERAENWLLIKEHDGSEKRGEDAAALEQPSKKTPAKRQRKGRAAKTPAGWAIPDDAVPAGLPDKQAPMLASTADAPPEGAEWVSEIKFDGYRLLVRKNGDDVRLLTRNGLDWTRKFGAIADAIRALPAETLLADGEAVALRNDGVSSFAMLQQALSDGRTDGLVLYLFDLLYRDGMDLRGCDLETRKRALEDLPQAGSAIRFSTHLAGVGAAMRVKACEMGLEGIICKRADSPYRAGRGRAWLKIKCQGREEFVVIGYTRPQGSRSGLGALQLGFYDGAGKLHYAGGCGSGFSDAVLKDLAKQLGAIKADRPDALMLTEEPPPRGVIWVEPALVAEVQYTAWSGSGRLRHAVFLALRQDKAADEVVRDLPDPEAVRHRLGGADDAPLVVTARKPAPRAPGGRKPSVRKTAAQDHVSDGVRLTHPDRELWPGITKQALANYWNKVADHALPGITGRPLAFLRCPDGLDGQHFFQKHASKGMPAALHEGAFDGAPYLALDDEAGLAACAQIAAIELHSWGSEIVDAGRPERLVFDLDPGEGTPWTDIITAAHDIRERLERAGLAAFPRTSGGNGLHLVVPLSPAADWDTARAWCRAFAEAAEHDAPAKYVASVPKARRRGKILIDWLRNGLGSTAIASFSPRARPHATVATPLNWAEVTPRLDTKKFTIATVPSRLAKLKSDPWADFHKTRQKLPKQKGASMAERPIWRGHLRLALVSCPVALHTAHHESSNLHFHFINPKTGNRVRTVTQDAETDEELTRRDLSRGYEFEKEQYVILDEDDFDRARIDSNATMTVDKFVPRDAIDPVYFNTAYYMTPDGDAGQDVYVVLRDAIAAAGRIALSRVVIARRERAVAILPMARGLIVHTLFEEREIASAAALFDHVPRGKPDAEMIKLARMLIDRQTAKFDPADMEDRYETRLRAVIDAKIKGVRPKAAAKEPKAGNVVDLMEALKRSLGQDAKPAARKPRRKAG